MNTLFWHYLGSFLLYTMLSIGAIYATYVWLRKNPDGLNALMQLSLPTLLSGGGSIPGGRAKKLAIETVLPLEPRKSLYIIRADQERFLIASSLEGTQFLAKLDAPAPSSEGGDTAQPADAAPQQAPASILKYLQRTSAE